MKLFRFLIPLLLTLPAGATVTTLTFSVPYTCTGTVGPYAFNYPIYATSSMTVTQNGTLLTSSQYTIVPVNNNYNNGGSVRLNVACPSGQPLVLTRVTPITQTQVFTDNMPTPMKAIESGLDKLTEIDQEIAAKPAVTSIVPSATVTCTPDVNGKCVGDVSLASSGGGAANPSAPLGSVQYNNGVTFGGQGGQLIATAFSGADLVAKINAAFTACSHVCDVHIPAGNYTVASGTINMNYSTESLTGDGADKVNITYAGTNFLDRRNASAPTYSFQAQSEVSGFLLTCTNAAAKCFTQGSTLNSLFRDLIVIGPAGVAFQLGSPGTSQCFVFQNTFDWMEDWKMEDVRCGGFQTNLHFMAPTGSGTNSFAYGKVDGLWTSQAAGTYGVVVDSGANVYGMLGWSSQVNSASTTSADEYFRIAGEFRGEGFHVTGENTGASYTFAHVLSGGHMIWNGDFHTFGSSPIVVDANQSGGSELPFNVVTPSGSFYKTGGIPLLSNYDGSGHNFNVFPLDFPDQDATVAARVGYLYDTTNGNSSIYDAFNNGTKRCIFLRGPATNESALTPVWCLDGSANTVHSGSETNSITNSTTQINTPLWVSANPIVQGSNTTGNILSALDNFGATKMFGDHGGVWHATAFQLSSGFVSCSVGNAGLIQYQHFGGSTPDIMTGCVDTTGGGSYSAVSMLGGGGGSSTWNAITNPTGNQSLSMTTDTTLWTWGAATGSGDLFKKTDTASNTGTGILDHDTTASGSTEIPWQGDANGVGWQVTATGALQGVGTATSHGFVVPEGTALSGVASNDVFTTNSTIHRFVMNNNNVGPFTPVGTSTTAATAGHLMVYATNGFDAADGGAVPSGGTTTIASGTSALGTSSIASGACATVVTTTATGVASTDAIAWNPNGSIKAVTGYVPATTGGLSIAGYPTSGNVNWDVCNWSSGSITPGAVTLNWRVTR